MFRSCLFVGAYGRNVPFREDIIESVIRTTVSVANGHPLVPPLSRWSMMVNHDPLFLRLLLEEEFP